MDCDLPHVDTPCHCILITYNSSSYRFSLTLIIRIKLTSTHVALTKTEVYNCSEETDKDHGQVILLRVHWEIKIWLAPLNLLYFRAMRDHKFAVCLLVCDSNLEICNISAKLKFSLLKVCF